MDARGGEPKLQWLLMRICNLHVQPNLSWISLFIMWAMGLLWERPDFVHIRGIFTIAFDGAVEGALI